MVVDLAGAIVCFCLGTMLWRWARITTTTIRVSDPRRFYIGQRIMAGGSIYTVVGRTGDGLRIRYHAPR